MNISRISFSDVRCDACDDMSETFPGSCRESCGFASKVAFRLLLWTLNVFLNKDK